MNAPQLTKTDLQRRIFRKCARALALAVCLCAASPVFAQLLPPLPPEPGDSLIDDLLPPILPPSFNTPLIADRSVIIPQVALPTQLTGPLAPERPTAPDRAVLPQTVKDLVKDFQVTRQDFLNGQRELLRQLKDAKQEERSIIREQLKERLNEWRELQKSHLRELRDQAREITTTLPAIGDVINSGSGEGRGR